MSNRPVIVRPRRAPPVLVCRKCLKRADDGRAIKRALKEELARYRGGTDSSDKATADVQGKPRKIKPPKLMLTGCFGICPKRAVVMTAGATLARGEFVLVRDESEVRAAVEMVVETTA